MRVLILGGTVFLGRHLVDAALDRGDQVTLFHRGRHPAPRAAEVVEVFGDRSVDLNRLPRNAFDVVIDTCGYLPADVRRSAEVIDAERYVFVSSGSVYTDTLEVPLISPLQWFGVAAKGLLRLSADVPALRYGQARRLWVVPDHPVHLHLDGDVVGRVADLRVRIGARSLLVKAPAKDDT